MLKDLADGLALVVSAMRSLSYLLEDDILDLAKTLRIHSNSCALQAPYFQDSRNEVVLLIDGGHGVAVGIVVNEGCLSDFTRFIAALLHELNEVVHDNLGALLAGGYTRVLRSVVL